MQRNGMKWLRMSVQGMRARVIQNMKRQKILNGK